MSEITLREGKQLYCPNCEAWLAEAIVDIIGGESVIGDENFLFAEDIWGKVGGKVGGLSCPNCAWVADSHFIDPKNWE